MIVGTECKVLVMVEPIDGVHMSGMEFSCLFYTDVSSPIEIKKDQMIKVDDDSYIALLDTSGFKPGTLRNRMIVDIPDHDFLDGFRREIADMEIDAKILQ